MSGREAQLGHGQPASPYRDAGRLRLLHSTPPKMQEPHEDLYIADNSLDTQHLDSWNPPGWFGSCGGGPSTLPGPLSILQPPMNQQVPKRLIPCQNRKHRRARTIMWIDAEGTNVTVKKQSQQKKRLSDHHFFFFFKINKQGALGSDIRAKSPA